MRNLLCLLITVLDFLFRIIWRIRCHLADMRQQIWLKEAAKKAKGTVKP